MILCCGDALIDMLPSLSDANETAFAPHPGGAAFNTAIALGRLGIRTGFLGGLSSDRFGEMLVEALENNGVASATAMRSNRPTTLAFVQMSAGQATYQFYDKNSAARMVAASDLPDIPADVTTLTFGGISLINEPCAATFETLMARVSGSYVTMLDPNVRPEFITDEAVYRARMDRMIKAADIVKVSDEDLRWLGGDGATRDLARAMLERGPTVVFVTEGAKGARAITAKYEEFVAAPATQVVDTVGAGDTFNAGILAALDQRGILTKARLGELTRDTLNAALELGTKCAAISVARAGADPPWKSEL